MHSVQSVLSTLKDTVDNQYPLLRRCELDDVGLQIYSDLAPGNTALKLKQLGFKRLNTVLELSLGFSGGGNAFVQTLQAGSNQPHQPLGQSVSGGLCSGSCVVSGTAVCCPRGVNTLLLFRGFDCQLGCC